MNEPTPTRLHVIRTILERYSELVDPMQSRSTVGDGVAIPLMPGTYTPTVREVERILNAMRDSGHPLLRRLWWNLHERYIAATTRTVSRTVTRKVKGGKRLTVTERHVQPVFDHRVNERMVSLGVRWVASEWSLRGEPMLPRELQVSAA